MSLPTLSKPACQLQALQLLLVCTVIWLGAFLGLAEAKNKLLAADLVEDGQLIDTSKESYQKLFTELIADHGYSRAELADLFAEVRINRKVLVLMDKQWEAKPYHLYRPLFITPGVIKEGREHLASHRQLFDRIEDAFGVDREVVVAIWAIESRFGKNTGGFEIFTTLNTLFDAYPRRSEFFGKELKNYLILCKKNSIVPRMIKGSYAGAFGQAQFMPSSFNAYAVDFDNDQKIDLLSSLPDILASIANYLKSFGWVLNAPVYAEIGSELNSVALIRAYNLGRRGRIDWRLVAEAQKLQLPRPPQDKELSIVGLKLDPAGTIRYLAGYPNFHAITQYNHSHKYAMAVAELAESFGQ